MSAVETLNRNGHAWCLLCGWAAQERYRPEIVPVCGSDSCWEWWVTIYPITP